MLGIVDDERPLAAQLFDDEIEAVDRGIDRDERRGPVVIPARGDRTVPVPEAEDGCAILRADGQHPKHRGSVASGQLGDLGCIRRNHQFAKMIAFVEPIFLVLSSMPAFVNEAATPAQDTAISRREAAFIGQIPAFRITPLQSRVCRIGG